GGSVLLSLAVGVGFRRGGTQDFFGHWLPPERVGAAVCLFIVIEGSPRSNPSAFPPKLARCRQKRVGPAAASLARRDRRRVRPKLSLGSRGLYTGVYRGSAGVLLCRRSHRAPLASLAEIDEPDQTRGQVVDSVMRAFARG